jgi:glycosyltransferase involved in cell wall biosynthesis
VDDGTDNLEELIPRDSRVKYFHLPNKISISEKRNKLVELAENDYIVFMDDDDYYPPESLIARIKSLLKYQQQGIECVGCTDVANFDILHNKCAITSNGDNYLCESSLAFTKQFWKERGFPSNCHFGEFKFFLEYRQHQIRNIPFQFVTIALYHGHNITNGVRNLGGKWNNPNKQQHIVKEMFENDEDFIDFIKKIKYSK